MYRNRAERQTLKATAENTQIIALFIKTIEKYGETHIKTHRVRS